MRHSICFLNSINNTLNFKIFFLNNDLKVHKIYEYLKFVKKLYIDISQEFLYLNIEKLYINEYIYAICIITNNLNFFTKILL